MCTVEAEQDILTCGDCQREFILSDIVKFVQHKVNRCNCAKDKCQPFCEDREFEDEEDNEDSLSTPTVGASASTPIISNKRPSISAPIALKESTDLARDRLTSPLDDTLEEGEVALPRLDKCDGGENGASQREGVAAAYHGHHSLVRNKLQCMDAAVNTVASDSAQYSGNTTSLPSYPPTRLSH